MNRIALFVCATLVVLAAAAEPMAAGYSRPNPKRFEFLPAVHYSLGETEYVLEARGLDSLGETIYVKSLLEFPIDGFQVGGTLRFTVDPLNPMPWYIEVGGSTNLTDPTGIMRDRDWSNSWNNVYLSEVREVSNTESDVKMNSVLIDAAFGKVVAAAEKSEISLFAGFRYHWISQEIVGLSGYQYDTRGDSLFYFDYPGLRGIDYRVTYSLPHAGLRAAMSLNQNTSVSAHGAYSIVFVSDRDDHLLRHKLSTSSVTGNGFIGGGEITFAMSRGRSAPVYLTLSGEFVYLSASGTQTQVFYGDDPGTPGDETGEKISGVPHKIHSTQGRLGLEMGFRF